MKKIFLTLLLISIVFAFGFSLALSSIYEKYLGVKYGTFYSDKKSPHRLYNNYTADRSNIAWSTGNHTASPLPIGAVGPEKYISQLHGVIQNTKLAEVMREAVNDKVNVILLIGDGFGVNHMSLSIYKNVAERNGEITYFEKIMNEGETGLMLTNNYDGIVTASSDAATAMACGKKTNWGMVGVDHEGTPLESVLDEAESVGMVTGLITTASILDGTPAGFFANNKSRHAYENLAEQLVDEYEIEVIMGGGGEYFIPAGTMLSDFPEFNPLHKSLDGKSRRKDERNLLLEMKGKGYNLICNNEQLACAEDKLFGLFSASGLNATVDIDYEQTGEPTLVDMASKALEILVDDENGYFAMIEAARIDWEAHDNDAGAVALAVEEMNRVLKICYEYYEADPENTLLIFTGDHETGGLSISYNSFPDGIKRVKTLHDGQIWESGSNNLPFENYSRLYEQKRSVYRILQETNSAEDLFEQLNKFLPLNVTIEEAQNIFEVKKNYVKAK